MLLRGWGVCTRFRVGRRNRCPTNFYLRHGYTLDDTLGFMSKRRSLRAVVDTRASVSHTGLT